MKRLMVPVLILLAAVLIVKVGYPGFNNAKGNPVQADAYSSTPPTVPVTRGDVQQTVIAPGQLVGTREIVLGTDVGGRLAEINVRPGDVVRKGDVLVRLDTKTFEDALQEAQLRLKQAQAEYARQLALAELDVRTVQTQLEEAEAEHARQLVEAGLTLKATESRLNQARLQYPSLTAAEVRLQNAVQALGDAEREYKEALERQKAKWEPEQVAEDYQRVLEATQDEHVLAQAEYSAVQRSQAANSEAFKALETQVEQAKTALERLQAGVDPLLALELEKAQKAMSDLQAIGVDPFLARAVQEAQADLRAATLVAPFEGVVLKVNARPGTTVSPGAELIVLTNPSSAEVHTTVIEEDLPRVQISQPVELFFDAWPEASVDGRVARIVPQRVQGQDRPLYPVYIAADDLPKDLLPGMTADASIIVAQQKDVLRLPRALVRAGSGGTAQVEVWADGQAQEREVQIGLRGDVYAEILNGLHEGEQVVGQ